MQVCVRGFRGGLCVLALAVLTACGTPGPVKELSQSQIVAFDTVITAATAHHEALIAAAELIVKEKKQSIDKRTDSFAADVASEVQSNPGSAKATVATYRQVVEEASESKARLDGKLAEISNLSARLVASLQEMRAAQQALNAYLEAEAVGEAFVSSITGKPGVQSFTKHVTEAIAEATSLSQKLKSAINGLSG